MSSLAMCYLLQPGRRDDSQGREVKQKIGKDLGELSKYDV